MMTNESPLTVEFVAKTSENTKNSGGLWRVMGMDSKEIIPSMAENRIDRVCLVSGYNPCSYLRANDEVKELAHQNGLYYWCRFDPLDEGANVQCSKYLKDKHCAGLFFHPFEENLACSSTLFLKF